MEFIRRTIKLSTKTMRYLSHPKYFKSSNSRPPTFGVLFDIDGVIIRGSKVLPQAIDAFKKLTDENGRFKVPTIFVTNAGNCLRQKKADQLSDILGVKITEDQVVMSHSPLKMFKNYHDKHVLVVGQGPISEIANNLGFKNVTTMDEYRLAFPVLDCVDHERRKCRRTISWILDFLSIEPMFSQIFSLKILCSNNREIHEYLFIIDL